MSANDHSRAASGRIVRPFAALLISAALAAGLAYAINPHRPRFDPSRPPEIALASVPARDVLWIDARSALAYAKDHVPAAISLNEDDWENSLPIFVEHWNPGQTVVVYCDSSQCHASEAVARRLVREFNATHVFVLKGGWDTWTKRK